MLVSNAVHIWRESDGDYHIEWRASHPDTQVTVEPVISNSAAQAHYDADTERVRVSGLAPANRTFSVCVTSTALKCWQQSVNWGCRERLILEILGGIALSTVAW